MDKPLVNRVAASGLITINLEDFFPTKEVVEFDLKPFLFMEMILKEKDFRTALKELDWSQYADKNVAIYCSADAIIPVWAYMLVATYLEPVAADIIQGNKEAYYLVAFQRSVEAIDLTEYEGKRIVIKGCSNKPVPPSAYVALTKALRPYAKSMMYGEPCSTVPIYKKPKK